jgi:Protein of unknown function (DUF1653)
VHRHYKGDLYPLLGVGEHTETEERVVVYLALTGHCCTSALIPRAQTPIQAYPLQLSPPRELARKIELLMEEIKQ